MTVKGEKYIRMLKTMHIDPTMNPLSFIEVIKYMTINTTNTKKTSSARRANKIFF
jgi:hypothetical protein